MREKFLETVKVLFKVAHDLRTNEDDDTQAKMRILRDTVLPYLDSSRDSDEHLIALATIFKSCFTCYAETCGMTYEDAGEAIVDLYVRKNTDYGNVWHSELEMFGMMTMYIRCWEKLNRIVTLLSAGKRMVEDESVCDTIRDVSVYCVMTAMWLIDEHGLDE